jgi:hypothetical protein
MFCDESFGQLRGRHKFGSSGLAVQHHQPFALQQFGDIYGSLEMLDLRRTRMDTRNYVNELAGAEFDVVQLKGYALNGKKASLYKHFNCRLFPKRN